jgi:hypothetical protein
MSVRFTVASFWSSAAHFRSSATRGHCRSRSACLKGHKELLPRLLSGWPLLPRLCCKTRKLQRSKIFGENLKRKEVDDSHSFSRATEVAHEFGARRRGPSDHYTKNAPAAPRIFDTSCKTTFATQSPRNRTSAPEGVDLATRITEGIVTRRAETN